jgi:sigma-B regulation protein RsbU (phosphoserine phosphatase)
MTAVILFEGFTRYKNAHQKICGLVPEELCFPWAGQAPLRVASMSYLDRVSKKLEDFHARIRRSEPYNVMHTYGRGLSRKEIEAFVKRDTVDTYAFYSRDTRQRSDGDSSKAGGLKRAFAVAKDVFVSFLMKLTPARRLAYGIAVVLFVWGYFNVDEWAKIVISFLLLNLLLAMELADKLTAKDELEIARAIQFSLQPEAKPRLQHLMISSHYQPAREVGGDYYDFSQVGENRFTLILGDVSGKGMPAALYAMKLQALFELLGKTQVGPKEMLVEMNEVICEKIRTNYFITAVVGIMDFENKNLRLARAGHNLPLHFNAATETTSWLNPQGIGIGMKKNPAFARILEETTLPLGVGDILLFYTDGIPEAMNPEDQEFGYQRIEKVVSRNAHRGVDEIKEQLLGQVNEFTRGAPMADDATLVIAKVSN